MKYKSTNVKQMLNYIYVQKKNRTNSAVLVKYGN